MMEVTIEQLRKDEQDEINSHSIEVKELRALLAEGERQLKFAMESLEVAKALIDSSLNDLKNMKDGTDRDSI